MDSMAAIVFVVDLKVVEMWVAQYVEEVFVDNSEQLCFAIVGVGLVADESVVAVIEERSVGLERAQEHSVESVVATAFAAVVVAFVVAVVAVVVFAAGQLRPSF
mgnify:CR=1 FL=1